ncbi:unnamed protein product [Trichobilharzia regenti]|nr:unnamed protein product [Trichobilharzia regenti]
MTVSVNRIFVDKLLFSYRRSVGVLTYYLLTGISPFLGEDKMITMQNITHATITYPDELFKHRSSNSIDFIQHLLQRSPKFNFVSNGDHSSCSNNAPGNIHIFFSTPDYEKTRRDFLLMYKLYVDILKRRMSARECLSHPWLQSIQTNVNAKDIQSNELLQNGNFSEFSSNDKCNLKYPLELCYAEPIFELSDELLSAFSLSFFTLETPVYITPCINPIAQNIVINSLSKVYYVKHPLDMQMYSTVAVGLTNLISNIDANALSSLDIEPINQYSLNLSKNLINGHFSLLKVLPTTGTTTIRLKTEKSCPVNRVHYNNNDDNNIYCNYNLNINTDVKNDDDGDSSTKMLPLVPLSSTVIPPTVQLPIKYLSNSFTNCDVDNLLYDDIYASSSLFVLRLIQAYSMLSTIYDLNYNNLLSYNCDISDYTTDTTSTSSISNITNNITYNINSSHNNRIRSSHPMSDIDPLLADSYHLSNKMIQTNSEVPDEDPIYSGVKKTSTKVSQYNIDTLPKVDECILSKIVKPHTSTVCIELKSSSGQYKIVINPLENNNNNNRYNHSWENSSIDFCKLYSLL